MTEPVPFSIIIGNNIKLCLEEYQLDVKALAAYLGVTRQTVATYINGTSLIDSHKLYLLAKRFHKRFDWFIESTHEIEPPFTPEQEAWIREAIVAYNKAP
jgi:transcriptional regulator with XRE-family HTH domain